MLARASVPMVQPLRSRRSASNDLAVFGGSRGIEVSGVDEVDAGIVRGANRRTGVSAARAAPKCRSSPDGRGPEAEPGDETTAAAAAIVPHGVCCRGGAPGRGFRFGPP